MKGSLPFCLHLVCKNCFGGARAPKCRQLRPLFPASRSRQSWPRVWTSTNKSSSTSDSPHSRVALFCLFYGARLYRVISVLTVILYFFQHLLKRFSETQTQANDLHSESVRSGYHFQFCICYLFISFLKNQQTYVKFSTSSNIIMSSPVRFLLHAANWKRLFHFYNYFKYVLECVYMCFIFLLQLPQN